MRLGFDRFSVVLDACVLFPMIVRDVMLTLAGHGFFEPKWSARLHDEWSTNLHSRLQAAGTVEDIHARIRALMAAMDRAFPDALVGNVLPETEALRPVDPKDRHVVMTAIAARADAVVTFNLKDFAADHLRSQLGIEVLHPDQFILDLIDLNERRVVDAFRALRRRKKNPPWDVNELIERIRRAELTETARWLQAQGIQPLL